MAELLLLCVHISKNDQYSLVGIFYLIPREAVEC